METCCERTRVKIRTEEEKKKLTARVNRIVGQMNGVGRMIEEDRYCDDVLIQLAAIDKAVRSLSAVILEAHMNTCLIEKIKDGDYTAVSEVVDLFKRFQ